VLRYISRPQQVLDSIPATNATAAQWRFSWQTGLSDNSCEVPGALRGDHPGGVGEHDVHVDTDEEGGAIHGIMARVRVRCTGRF